MHVQSPVQYFLKCRLTLIIKGNQAALVWIGVRRFSHSFKEFKCSLGGRRADRFYLDSCLICHIILSCIHSIHWKAAALFNITQRVTEPLAWLHSATVLMFAEMPKSKEINNSQFPWKIWGKSSDGLIKKNTASISAFKGCKTSQLYPTSQINYEIHKSPNWDSCF